MYFEAERITTTQRENMKHLLNLVLLAVLPISALANHFGTVKTADQTPLANVRIVSKLTNDTLFSDANGLFGNWPDAILHQGGQTKQTLAAPTLYNNHLYFKATSAGEKVQAAIVSPRGQVIWDYNGHSITQGVNRLSCESSLAQGIYFLRLSVGEKEFVTKVTNSTQPKYVSEKQHNPISTNRKSDNDNRLTVDTLTVSLKGHLRQTMIVDADANTPLSIVLTASAELPTVAIDKDSVKALTGSTITLNLTAVDNTGDITDFIWGTNPAALTHTVLTPTYTITATNGTTTYYVAARNEYGTLSLVDSVVIIGEDKGITLDAPDTMSVNEDSELVITTDMLTITDNSGSGPYTVVIATPIAGSNYTVKNGNTIVPNADFNGEMTISIQVSNGALLSNSENILVKVLPVNDAPTFKTITVDGVEVAISNNEITIPIVEFETKKISVVLDNKDVATPTLALNNKPDWVTTVTGTGPYEFTVAPDSYDLAENLKNATYNMTISASDPADPTIVNSLKINIVVSSKNRKPQIQLPATVSFQVGSLLSLGVGISDADSEDKLQLIPQDPRFVTTGSMLSTVAEFDFFPGETVNLEVKLTDNIDTVSGTMQVTIEKNEWEYLKNISDLVTITATSKNEIYTLVDTAVPGINAGRIASVSKLGDATFQYDISILYNPHGASYAKGMKQYGNKLYVNTIVTGGLESWTEIYNNGGQAVSDTSFDGAAYARLAVAVETGGIYVAGRASGGSGPTSPYIEGPGGERFQDANLFATSAIEAAHKGVNLFAVSEDGNVHRKLGAGNWSIVDNSAFSFVDIADDDGSVVYFVTPGNKSFRCTDGTGAVTIYAISGDITAKSVAKIRSFSADIIWILTTDEKLYFSNDGGKTLYLENISAPLKDVVVSEDRKCVFAIAKNGNIYRY